MATVVKRKESKFWCAVWWGINGKQIWRSTKQTDKKKALADALEYERAENSARDSGLLEAQARKIVADILERAGIKDIFKNPSIKEWLDEWVASKQENKATSTATRYKKIVDLFIEHLGASASQPLSAITARDIESFLTKRTKGGCGPTTVNLDGKILRTALNKARRQGLISTNPAEAAELPEKDSVERSPFSAAEVKTLVDTAEGEWKTLIMVGYFTGARLSDCCVMEWSSLDSANGTLTYVQRKTGKKVTIPLHPDLQAHLQQLPSSDEKFIMPGMADKGPGGRHGLSESFKKIMRKAGLDLQTVQGRGIRKISRRTFHSLRHSFTSALANANVAPELRMKLTGHSSEAVHRLYTHHELETLRNAVAKMPSLSGQQPSQKTADEPKANQDDSELAA